MKLKKGFTLIELLVVIAIISLLSSIVMASLSGAKNKTAETAFKQQMIELSKILELEHLKTNSYAALNASPWGGTTIDGVNNRVLCDTLYPLSSTVSEFIPQVNAVCKKLASLSPNQYALLLNATKDAYTINGWLNATGFLYCVSNNGNSFAVAGVQDGSHYYARGCIYNYQ